MGFMDSYVDPTSSSFISPEEKAELVASVTPLLLVGVNKAGTKFGPTYFCRVLLDGEERTLSFKAVDPAKPDEGGVRARDALLDGYIEYFANGGAAEEVAIAQFDRTFMLVDPSNPTAWPGREER